MIQTNGTAKKIEDQEDFEIINKVGKESREEKMYQKNERLNAF